MKFLVGLLAFASVLGTASTTTCMDIQTCAEKLKNPGTDNIDALCVLYDEAVNCMNEAFADCSNNPNIPKSAQGVFANLKTQFEEQGKTLCGGQNGGKTSNPEPEPEIKIKTYDDAKCIDVMNCMKDLGPVISNLRNSNSANACRGMGNAIRCLKSSVADCEKSNLMRGNELDTVKREIEKSEKQFAQYCGDGKGNNGTDNNQPQVLTFLMAMFLVCVAGWM